MLLHGSWLLHRDHRASELRGPRRGGPVHRHRRGRVSLCERAICVAVRVGLHLGCTRGARSAGARLCCVPCALRHAPRRRTGSRCGASPPRRRTTPRARRGGARASRGLALGRAACVDCQSRSDRSLHRRRVPQGAASARLLSSCSIRRRNGCLRDGAPFVEGGKVSAPTINCRSEDLAFVNVLLHCGPAARRRRGWRIALYRDVWHDHVLLH
jgi:hypothetical protein